MNRKIRVMAIFAAAAFLSPALVTATAGASAGKSPPCHSAFNPYNYSRAAVAACGYRTFPRESFKALPGGGRGVYYNLNGHQVEFLIPPAGFNPATASASQLSEYGYPPRPAGASARARWASETTNSKSAPAPPFVAETPMRADSVYNPNWSGYVVSGGSGTFTSAEALYPEPRFYHSSCAKTSDVTWAGIGGYYARKGESRYPLAQDGTGFGVPDLGSHQAWFEIYPENAYSVDLSGHIGYTFDAFVAWHGAGVYSFYMHDAKTNKDVAFREHNNSFSGISAEAINERPEINGKLTNLSNFETMTVSNSQANGHNISSYGPASGYLNDGRHGLWMENLSETHIMAQPSGISSGGHFTIRQDHCS